MPSKIIMYGITILLIVILYGTLATFVGETAASEEMLQQGAGSFDREILTYNGTETTLTLSDSTATITGLTAISHNQSWLVFDGDDDYIVNETNWAVTGTATINIWINRTGNTSAHQYFFESLTGTTPVFMCNSVSQVEINVGGVWGQTKRPFCSLYDNIWTMYTYVFNGTRYLTYINGTLVNVSGIGGGTTFTGFEVGGSINDGDGTPTINGSIDELRVYDIALSAAQLLEIYASGIKANSSINDTGLVLWMKFDDPKSTVATGVVHTIDVGSNGTLSGGSWAYDGINVTLVENTDYTLNGDTYTVINSDNSWRTAYVNYTDEWDSSYGFHVTIVNLITGFVALIVLVVAIGIMFKIFKEQGIM